MCIIISVLFHVVQMTQYELLKGMIYMKKFLRKANRGLILGGVLIIGVTAYVAVDLNRFKEEKPLIEQTINEYADAVEKFNITPEQYRELNVKYSKDDSDKQISEFNKFADEYWISGVEVNDDLYTWLIDKDYFRGSMRNLIDNKQRGYITDFSVDITDCKINKDGPNAAIVSCMANIYYVGTENSAVITPAGYNEHYTFFDPESPIEPRVMQTSFSQDCNFYMERKSEGWKITKCDYMDSYDVMVTPVQDSESEDKE